MSAGFRLPGEPSCNHFFGAGGFFNNRIFDVMNFAVLGKICL